MITCPRLERVPDARYKNPLNEFSCNAVAQNLVKSGLRHRKVNTGTYGHRLLVNTRAIPCYID